MGITVSAAEAAALVHRHERIVRGRLARGDVEGARKDNAGVWRIDTDMLAQVPGWTLDRERLAALELKEQRTPAGILAQVERLASELRQERELRRALERRLTALEGLITRALGTLGSDDAPEALDRYLTTRSEAQQAAAEDGSSVLAPVSASTGSQRPYNAFGDVSPHAGHGIGLSEDARRFDSYPAPRAVTLADRGGGAAVTFKTKTDAARWLVRHGIASESTPKTWSGWPPDDLTPAAALTFALEIREAARRRRDWRVTWRLHRCDDAACVCRDLLS